MSRCPRALQRVVTLGVALVLTGAGWAAPSQNDRYPGIGRAATPAEITAWDIDVRPDFKGLPKGSGTVAKGQDVWESKCSTCHGVFGESNEVFTPIVGGTTKQDIETGHVARLNDRAFPARTTLMKVSSISTLWDYIRRAMPWNAPKSLSVDEVYAVTAYILNMGGILPDDFELSDRNIAEVQKRLPNRNGTTTQHALWPGKGLGGAKPDVQAKPCMTDCTAEPKLTSFLPDFARNAHGNLSEQNRLVGAQRGADTSRPPGAVPASPAIRELSVEASAARAAPAELELLRKNGCVACHGVDQRIVGPAFKDVAAKHAGRDDLVTYLKSKIRAGGSGVWGTVTMPAQTLSEDDVASIARWIADGAKN